jgi:hypothetical protein
MKLDHKLIDTDLECASSDFKKSWERYQPKAPELLFHYTDAKGMLGILEYSQIWATNYRFLNDSSEIAYGMSVFNGVASAGLEKSTTDVVREFLRRSPATANAFDGPADFYTACFCERDDVLNQWRVYAASGGGFAIGLAAREFGRGKGPKKAELDFFLRKVIYDKSIQEAIFADVIDRTSSILDKATKGASLEDANNLIAACCAFVRRTIAEYLICFKHPAFKVEEEWRLCHEVTSDDEKHLQFRDGPYGLTPFVRLNMSSEELGEYRGRLPVAKVTHGPALNPANVQFALQKYIKLKDHWLAKVGGSELPARVTK